jgi:hypothetical protein
MVKYTRKLKKTRKKIINNKYKTKKRGGMNGSGVKRQRKEKIPQKRTLSPQSVGKEEGSIEERRGRQRQKPELPGEGANLELSGEEENLELSGEGEGPLSQNEFLSKHESTKDMRKRVEEMVRIAIARSQPGKRNLVNKKPHIAVDGRELMMFDKVDILNKAYGTLCRDLFKNSRAILSIMLNPEVKEDIIKTFCYFGKYTCENGEEEEITEKLHSIIINYSMCTCTPDMLLHLTHDKLLPISGRECVLKVELTNDVFVGINGEPVKMPDILKKACESDVDVNIEKMKQLNRFLGEYDLTSEQLAVLLVQKGMKTNSDNSEDPIDWVSPPIDWDPPLLRDGAFRENEESVKVVARNVNELGNRDQLDANIFSLNQKKSNNIGALPQPNIMAIYDEGGVFSLANDPAIKRMPIIFCHKDMAASCARVMTYATFWVYYNKMLANREGEGGFSIEAIKEIMLIIASCEGVTGTLGYNKIDLVLMRRGERLLCSAARCEMVALLLTCCDDYTNIKPEDMLEYIKAFAYGNFLKHIESDVVLKSTTSGKKQFTPESVERYNSVASKINETRQEYRLPKNNNPSNFWRRHHANFTMNPGEDFYGNLRLASIFVQRECSACLEVSMPKLEEIKVFKEKESSVSPFYRVLPASRDNILLIDRLLSNKSDNEANDAIINIITSELFAAINGINKKRIEAKRRRLNIRNTKKFLYGRALTFSSSFNQQQQELLRDYTMIAIDIIIKDATDRAKARRSNSGSKFNGSNTVQPKVFEKKKSVQKIFPPDFFSTSQSSNTLNNKLSIAQNYLRVLDTKRDIKPEVSRQTIKNNIRKFNKNNMNNSEKLGLLSGIHKKYNMSEVEYNSETRGFFSNDTNSQPKKEVAMSTLSPAKFLIKVGELESTSVENIDEARRETTAKKKGQGTELATESAAPQARRKPQAKAAAPAPAKAPAAKAGPRRKLTNAQIAELNAIMAEAPPINGPKRKLTKQEMEAIAAAKAEAAAKKMNSGKN